MSNNAFYVYGIVKFGIDLDLNEKGLNGKNVHLVSNGNFSTLVHDCKEKPYIDEDPEKIKNLIFAHNKILDKAIEDFKGVIPLSFNTIIKRGKNSAYFNLNKWLNDNQEKLEIIWNKIKGKREYGIRVYYQKNKLFQEAANLKEVKKIKNNLQRKGEGVSYLLQEKKKSKTQEIFQIKVNKLKQNFYNEIKKITKEVVINPSRISIKGEKDLLLGLSVLIEEKGVSKIKEFLEEKEKDDFSFHLTGPFAPYSFIENGRK